MSLVVEAVHISHKFTQMPKARFEMVKKRKYVKSGKFSKKTPFVDVTQIANRQSLSDDAVTKNLEENLWTCKM